MARTSRLFALLVCLCAIVSFGSVHAQEDPDASGGTSSGAAGENGAGFMIGIRTGVNYNKFMIAGDGSSEVNQRRVGFVGGAFATYNFSQWIGVSADVLFSQYGARRVAFQTGNVAGIANYTMENIEANLLADFKLPVISVYKPKFYIGPSFNFNMGSGVNLSANSGRNIVFNNYSKWNTVDQFRPVEFGIIVGGGLDFDLKFATLKIDARYRRGWTDINTHNVAQNQAFRGRTIHNNTLSFTAGLGFKI
ncbi:MAG: PorT family protein [Bernardetiaceae bacterium]|nr:PorT family protein [Bernardetiaceae bacterium]